MFEQPDLSKPYSNEAERAAALSVLLRLSLELEQWLDAAAYPGGMSPARRATLSFPIIEGDNPESRISRWANLFDDELRVVLDSRNRVVHGLRLNDKEIRGAVWLAGQLLRLVDSTGKYAQTSTPQ